MLRTHTYRLLLYCENKRYTNPYHKINTVIGNKMREKIMIDFSIKETICINKTHPEHNKEIVYFDKMCQANYQRDTEHNHRH